MASQQQLQISMTPPKQQPRVFNETFMGQFLNIPKTAPPVRLLIRFDLDAKDWELYEEHYEMILRDSIMAAQYQDSMKDFINANPDIIRYHNRLAGYVNPRLEAIGNIARLPVVDRPAGQQGGGGAKVNVQQDRSHFSGGGPRAMHKQRTHNLGQQKQQQPRRQSQGFDGTSDANDDQHTITYDGDNRADDGPILLEDQDEDFDTSDFIDTSLFSNDTLDEGDSSDDTDTSLSLDFSPKSPAEPTQAELANRNRHGTLSHNRPWEVQSHVGHVEPHSHGRSWEI